MDVFKDEPPQITNPLFSAPNTLLTPHIAGITAEAVEGLAIGSAQAVADLYLGKRPAFIVNPAGNKKALALSIGKAKVFMLSPGV